MNQPNHHKGSLNKNDLSLLPIKRQYLKIQSNKNNDIEINELVLQSRNQVVCLWKEKISFLLNQIEQVLQGMD